MPGIFLNPSGCCCSVGCAACAARFTAVPRSITVVLGQTTGPLQQSSTTSPVTPCKYSTCIVVSTTSGFAGIRIDVDLSTNPATAVVSKFIGTSCTGTVAGSCTVTLTSTVCTSSSFTSSASLSACAFMADTGYDTLAVIS
jgi:hypothetical protein